MAGRRRSRPLVRPLAVPRLGLLTVRSFLRSPLPAAALAALLLIPLLYSGMYLWSFWDPFGRMEHLPVALVNEDEPVEVGGREVDAGGELTDTLLERGDLDWHLVSAREAARGVADGTYYVSLTIPSDFSADLTSPSRDRESPSPATLEAHYNDSNSFVVRQLAGSAFREIREAAGASAINGYLDQIFLGFNEIHGRTEEAAEGADELSGGAGEAEEGSSELSGGVGEAHTGAGELSGGLDQLYAGSQDLASGAATASEEVSAQVDKLDALADEWLPQLEEDIPSLQEHAGNAAEVTAALSAALEELPEVDTGALEEVDGRLAAHLEEHPELETEDPDLYTLLCDLQEALNVAESAAGFVEDNRDAITATAEDAAALSAEAAALSEDLPAMVERAEDARERADELDEGLDEGADQVPTYSEQGRDDASSTMSRPVRLDSAVSNEAPDYGTGFTPFFVPLSLWVGAMVVFMVLPALSSRALASSAPSWRVALAGRVAPLLLGVGQVLVMMTALHLLLGLEAGNWPLLIAFLVLTAAAFAATVQYLNAAFGAAGRVVALALLVLQLTSAGGTYPIETSPAFFQAVGPFLPLHWGVTALRHMIGGGDPDLVRAAFGVMALWLVVPLLLTWWTVERKRVWTMGALHPALKL
ncbi:YhgE/Pip domain-containing protein [Nocardiopsis dassonvillei]|uniref:YhgE/Pip domain-containing protein n=1 Tax=Nocardiopsis dassonvillei TaxID=2014 RepID=UPI0020A398B0|nr:YhgE/Pip domain-containing protein [Nocardiopsis dassonvillei]MCP3016166.1 YhgE/Pip domain-containing protein [Nocardiopsis dassonvillei]